MSLDFGTFAEFETRKQAIASPTAAAADFKETIPKGGKRQNID